MRSTPDGASSILAMACFPLVPFSNRIADATFEWQGRTVSLDRNFPPEPHAIHGHGWEGMWAAAGHSDTELTLTFDWPGGAWPWAYRARQTFALNAGSLAVTLSVTNRSDEAMPAGLGLHPQFPRPPGTRVTFNAGGMWRADDRNLPVALDPVPGHLTFGTGQVLDDVIIDNCFAGWDRLARVDWPDGTSMELTAEPAFGHLVLYVPPGDDYLSLEPVTHANNAIRLAAGGRDDTGLTILEPDETLTTSVRFRVFG